MRQREQKVMPLSPTRRAFRRLRRNRIACTGALVLVILYLAALLAPFVAPYHYDDVDRRLSYCPTMRLRLVDTDGTFHLRPFVYQYRYYFDQYANRVYYEDTSNRYPLRLFVRHADRRQDYRFLGLRRTNLHLFGVTAPGRVYLLGADWQGRDLASRILYGSRISLTVGLVGVAITFVLGMLVGGLAGYAGGKVDSLLMRLCEMIMLAPSFYLMLALRSSLPAELPSTQVYLLIVLILSFIGWAGFARVVRGMVLSLREKEYVLSARAAGASHWRIITRHILPNTLSYAIVSITVSIPAYILGETGLSFIGLGIQEPEASWGNLLAEAMAVSEIKFHPWVLLPGVFIFVAIMAYNFLGDGLRDAFDPRNLET